MLTITPRQLGIFQTVAEACFERELVLFFRQRHLSTVVRLPSGQALLGEIPESTLMRMIATGVAKAKSYGIRGQAAVAGFLTVMVEAAPNFDADPFLRRYLLDADVPPNARIAHLMERASKEDWMAVKKAYDPQAWALNSAGEGIDRRG